ncbi:hypothetical protein DJFAAGMI_00354 [Comamonas sp. PE63]|uniref:Uncharacterized protein n=2 Tax=Comamonas brasiliensis TaxID=1812482 RepID=A0ABS5LN30_9BURK|nr:hypothetical protein [Comamonas sp. PE63]
MQHMPDDLPLATRLLLTLAQLQGSSLDAVSLPRLGKHLGQSASVLMRELSALGDAELGGARGPGWVQIHNVEGHWRASLTEAGRAVVLELQAGFVLSD